jgi:hypothetical protein
MNSPGISGKVVLTGASRILGETPAPTSPATPVDLAGHPDGNSAARIGGMNDARHGAHEQPSGVTSAARLQL